MKRFPPLGQAARCAARGQIAVMLVVLLPVLLLLAGLVIDGGVMLIQYRRGQIALDSAALAAASVADPEFGDARFVDGTQKIKIYTGDGCNAYTMIADYAQKNGQGVLTVTFVDVYENKVTVCGMVRARTIFMRLAGITEVPFDLCASAELKYGIDEEGQ